MGYPRTEKMTLEELKTSPILKDIVKYAKIFEEIRNPIAYRSGWKPKKILSEKEPWNSNNFKHFAKLYRIFKEIPEIVPEDYIKAQFLTIKRREVFVTDLVSEFAIKRYKQFLKMKPAEKPKVIDKEKIKERDKDYLSLYCNNNSIKTPWDSFSEFEGIDVPVPIFLWLRKNITHLYLLDAFGEETIKWAKLLRDKGKVSHEHFKSLLIVRDMELYESPDEAP